ncbi:ABC transporter permease [Patescibacteria group bacterium]|nr:ABC transporter permease [Patescibacteria group bacterium]
MKLKITKSNWDLLAEMIKTDFKLRYHGSLLGFLWVLLKPFCIFLILYIIFYYLFARGDEYFALRLILGLIVYSFFAEATTHGINSLLGKANIILKVNFPRQIVVFASVINSLITLGISFFIFLIFWVFKPTAITWLWLLFPVYILVLTLFVLGISFFTSIISVRFRDLQNIWDVLLQVLFYASAVFYPISILPEKLQKWIYLNPLTIYIQQIRQILVDGELPDMKLFVAILLLSVGTFILGYLYFRRNIKKVAEYF